MHHSASHALFNADVDKDSEFEAHCRDVANTLVGYVAHSGVISSQGNLPMDWELPRSSRIMTATTKARTSRGVDKQTFSINQCLGTGFPRSTGGRAESMDPHPQIIEADESEEIL